jgi:hypothetical protein
MERALLVPPAQGVEYAEAYLREHILHYHLAPYNFDHRVRGGLHPV